MKKLVPWLLGLGMLFAPAAVQAAVCPVVHTFVTGETLTATNLNANPNQWAACFNNINYQNIGSAGIFASQIIPQSNAQATFGGNYPYTFTLPPVFSSPLTQANGGTGTANGVINGVGFGSVTSTNPGLTTDGADINLDGVGYAGIGIGYDDGSLHQIQFGPSGNWATFNGTTSTLATNLVITGSGNTVTAPLVSTTNGLNITGSSQTNGIYNDGSGNIEFYDGTNNHTFGIILYHNTGKLLSNGMQTYVSAGSHTYDNPYDADSTGGSNYTHVEHYTGSNANGNLAAGACQGPYSFTFAQSYGSVPDVVITGGASSTSRGLTIVTITNITQYGFTAQVCNPGAASQAQPDTFHWISLGE